MSMDNRDPSWENAWGTAAGDFQIASELDIDYATHSVTSDFSSPTEAFETTGSTWD